jgi:hypothetical protein
LLKILPNNLDHIYHIDSERQAAEPVFSVKEDDLEFQTFESVFLTGVDDPALLNAVMLTFALGVTDGNINQECLGYLNRATKSIRERMNPPENAASVAVLGAILLLAGVEVCSHYIIDKI